MRFNRRWKTLLMATILLFTTLMPIIQPVTAAGGGGGSGEEDMQAQQIQAIFNSQSEDTSVSWFNVVTILLPTLESLQSSRYLVYRHHSEMNSSMVANNEISYIGNISACIGALSTCSGQMHTFEYDLPPSQDGDFYYGVATNYHDVINGTWTMLAFMELGVSQIGQPISEFTHNITAPFSVNATFYPELSQTKIDWINLNQLTPGTLIETGDNAYVSNIYRHLAPANRENWMYLDKALVGNTTAGISTYTYTVPPFTDVNAYYSVTYTYLGYEDTRFIGGVNTMDEYWPVKEDNVAPNLLLGGVHATFNAEPIGGTGNTTITWTDNLSEQDAVYHVWRSGVPFNNTNDINVEHIAAVSSGIQSYDYEVERGTLGYAYYAVTIADARGNHDSMIDNSVLEGPIMENTFDPWIAEPTNVQATYLGGGFTNVTWTDQVGAEGESYHVWHAWTKLSAATNLSLEATLVATVPDGVQYALIPIPIDKDRLSYYCVTSVTRYNHLGATYEDTRFLQNCILLPVNEDTLAPAPVTLAQPMLQGGQRTVLLSWINSLAEEGETYTVWRNLGTPFDDNETGNISDDDGWEMMIDNYEPIGAETTILREIYLPAELDRFTWYALIVADTWGNSRDSLSNRSNAWLVHEDTTGAFADVTIGLEGEDGVSNGALKGGDYRLSIFSNEPLQEFPLIHVYTSEYDASTGSGNTFTPEQEITRATPFLSSDTHFIWDFPIPNGMQTSDLVVEATLIDDAGNSRTVIWENWSIDAESPAIELFAPSYDSKYLYGDDVRIHGVVTDDVGLVEVKFRLIDVREFFENPSQWELVNDVSPLDTPSNTLIFDMKEPSATFVEPGNHKVEILATDTAGNERLFVASFYVDHCYENLSGMTFCESGNSPFNEEAQEPEAPPDLTSPPYIIIIAVGAFNVLLLLFAVLMGVLAAQDPTKKKKKGDDEDEDDDDDWMLEFMGGGDSGAAADAGLSELEAAPSKALVEDDDPFDSGASEKKKRRKKSSKSKDEEMVDGDDDDDDDWGDDDDDEPKKEKKRRRPAKSGKSQKRKVVKRKNK